MNRFCRIQQLRTVTEKKEEKVKNLKRFFPNIIVCCVVTSSIFVTPIMVNAADKDPKPKSAEHCWNFSNPDLETSGKLQLGVTDIGDGHRLCSGVVTVVDPISFQGSTYGNIEYLAGEFHMTLSAAGIRNGVIGIDMMKARLDPTSLDGTFESIGVYFDAVEISSGTLTYTDCQ